MTVPSNRLSARAGRRVFSAWVLALVGALVAALAGPISSSAADTGATPAAGIQPPSGFAIQTVQSGLDAGPGGKPTQFAYAPDGRIFVARKTGILNVWDNGVQHIYADLRTEVNSYQSRGFIGMALDPNYAANGRVYLLFTQELDTANPDSPEPAGGELISLTHAAGDPDSADPASRITLMTGFDSQATLHSVAGLRFGNDGSLFVGLGDGNGNGVGAGTSIKAQDLTQLNGKILRIDKTTGNGVPSNPYYNANNPGSVKSRVFAWGFRNPFRFTVDPSNGTLYVGDVGWNTWEMFQVFPLTTNNPQVDRNAGWPCYEGGDGVSLVQPDYASSPLTSATCHAIYTPSEGGTGPGALAPLYAYLHSDPGGDYGSAIAGGPRYLGTSNYPSSYVGKVFIGDYARSRLQTVDLTTGDATDFGTAGTWANPVDLQIAPDGNVAFLAFTLGELDEIVATGSNNPPVAAAAGDVTTTTDPTLTVHFSSAGSSDPDGDPITYAWDFGDGGTSTATNPTHTYAKGVFQAVLTVTDSHGAKGTAKLQIAVGVKAPVVKIFSPKGTFHWKIGDNIPIVIKAKDPLDGKLAGSSVSTEVTYWTGGHVFPVTEFVGTSGSFVAADNGFVNAFYRITTTGTNSSGLSTVVTRDLKPQTVRITVTSKPVGLTVTVDGIARTTPYRFQTIVGSDREVVAPATATNAKGKPLAFESWTVGAAAPSTDTFAHYTAPTDAISVVAKYSVVHATAVTRTRF